MKIDYRAPVVAVGGGESKPVSIYFDEHGVPCFARLEDRTFTINPATDQCEHRGAIYDLRNVAPPKPEPVLREAWINCYDPARFEPGVHPTPDAAERYARSGREACLKVAWMSDGSPVPGENVWIKREVVDSEIGRITAERDALRIDLESRIQESTETRKVIAALTADRDKWRDNANDALDELNAANDRQEQMVPVVEAAVVWERHFSAQASERLVGAVRAYLRDVAYPKKTAEGAVANVAAMMEPK
jgi:hypothetical protein